MPKYGIHHIVMAEGIKRLDYLGQAGNAKAQSLARLLGDHRGYAMLGAIGPDLFFWGPDYSLVGTVLDFYHQFEEVAEVYEQIEKIADDLKEKVGSYIDRTCEAVPLAAGQSFCQLFLQRLEQARDAYGSMKEMITRTKWLGKFELSTLGRGIPNLFNTFVPEVHYNQLELRWYWFDMLHYRRTGQFAQNLLYEAGNNPETQAFAYGYLSHIAADTVGHPFVNQVCGAPYRMTNWRHATAENFMDAWKYHRYYRESVNGSLMEKLQLPEPENLSLNLVESLAKAFGDTYKDVLHPIRLNNRKYRQDRKDTFGFYNVPNIQDTYLAFYKVLEFMKKSNVERPREPFPEVDQILADALSGAIPQNPPPPPAPPGLTCSWEELFGPQPLSSDCSRAFLQNVQNWANYVGDLLNWGSQTLAAIVNAVAAVVAYMPMRQLLALLYAIQLVSYSVYRSFHLMWSVLGILVPEPDELDWPLGRSLTHFNGLCAQPSKAEFPSRGFSLFPYNFQQSNLVCPPGGPENQVTAAGFYPAGSDPDAFIGTFTQEFNQDHLLAYARAEDSQQTKALQAQRKNMGPAVPLAVWMMLNATTDQRRYAFTDWNLDSDRGYGSLAWSGFIPKEGDERDFRVQAEQYCGLGVRGDSCFRHFKAAVPGGEQPDLVNAYLLSFASQWDYQDQLYIDPLEDVVMFQDRFKRIFTRWAMDTEKFRFLNFKKDNKYDTEVVLMPNQDPQNRFLIILFRGSETPKAVESAFIDWVLTDFYAIPHSVTLASGYPAVKVGKGLWTAFEPAAGDIVKSLRDFPGYKVWLTGNSLGGALATLCGLYLQLNGCPVEGVYTFAAPRVGDSKFRDLYLGQLSGRYHRWVNGTGPDQDLVTKLPPSTDPVYQLYVDVSEPHGVNENAPWLFKFEDPILPALPRAVLAHFTEGYSRGIFKQLLLDPRLAEKALSLPLPGH